MGKRKRYSEEFKVSAVKRVVEGQSVSQVSRECGASTASIHDWVRASEQAGRERPATAMELAEIKRLKRENRRLKEDAEILKKAMALYAEECR